MFYQLLFIHLFRPFLKYKPGASPLPAHVSPRKFCTHAAATISKLLRLYKKTYGLRQIVNLAVYITHTAYTIHLLNLPEKNAVRDIVHGLKHLEEIAEGWLCARKTLRILSLSARKWNIQLPEEAARLLEHTDAKFAAYGPTEQMSPIQAPTMRHAIPTTSTQTANNGPAQYGFAGNGYFSNSTAISPNSSPEAPKPLGYMPLPPQSAAELSKKPRSQQAVLPQAQQEMWNRDRASRGSSVAHNHTSPSVLFGGVDALVEDSQDLWLQRDTGSFFANWNGMEPHDMQTSNGTNVNGYYGTNFMTNEHLG